MVNLFSRIIFQIRTHRSSRYDNLSLVEKPEKLLRDNFLHLPLDDLRCINFEFVCSNDDLHFERLSDIISIILELKMLEKLRKFPS